MKILIAEDDIVSRKILVANLKKWGHEVIVTKDGNEAWEELNKDDIPNFAILDWMMPGKDGVDLCRNIRKAKPEAILYIILLTAKGTTEDIVSGLEAGADDYVIKPFNKAELKARVDVGERMVKTKLALKEKVIELQEALDNIKKLQGMIPICAWCKRVRTDDEYWSNVEDYISQNSEAMFSHSICPDCLEKEFGKTLESKEQGKDKDKSEGSLQAASESEDNPKIPTKPFI